MVMVMVVVVLLLRLGCCRVSPVELRNMDARWRRTARNAQRAVVREKLQPRSGLDLEVKSTESGR